MALEIKPNIVSESINKEKIILELEVPKNYLIARVDYKLVNLDDPILYQNFIETDIQRRTSEIFYIEMDRENFEKGEYLVDMIITTNHLMDTDWTIKAPAAEFTNTSIKFKVPARYIEY
jgi:hypothetical protein